ncbi:MAG: hypothetical protein Q4C42_09705 [Clostridia bacterium]|nr:hypothetical protein [Clostridia bacterium]
MKFTGKSRTFSTENDAQYETIGAFWDEMAEKYGRANLRGLGFNWTPDSIDYVIGLIDGIIDNPNIELDLPDDVWVKVKGKTDNLGQMYSEIYKEGNLTFEIEFFDDNGNCEVWYTRI